MPLQPCDKFGPYELLAFMGKFGVGELYHTYDTELQRDVALTVSGGDLVR